MPLTFPSNPTNGQTASYVFTNTNGVEIKRLWTFDSGASSWVATPSNLGSNGSGRYFYGPNSPTVDDIVMGERWFDTVVGTEYTYLPVAEGSSYLAWIDLDHLGQNESGDEYVKKSGDNMTGTLTGTDASFDSITATNGFIGTLTGNIADFGHITADTGFIGGSLTADRAFRTSDEGFVDDEFITKEYGENTFVNVGGDTMSGDLFVNRGFRDNDSPSFTDNEFITKEYAENNFGSGDIEITNDTNNSDPFSPYNWELTKIVLSRTDGGGTLLKSIYKIEPQKPSSGNLSGNNITLNFSYLCGNSTYDLLDIVLDVTINNTLESYGGIYYSAHSIHTNNIGKQFVNNNGAIKISYANSGPGPAWFNNTIYLSCLFKI